MQMEIQNTNVEVSEMKNNISRSMVGVSALAFSAYAGAATVSYGLTESNAMPDGTHYLTVEITQSASAEGVFDFLIRPESSLLLDGENAGIQAFGLNVEAAMTTETTANGGIAVISNPLVFTNLPEGWTIDTQKNMSEFGRYDIRLYGNGNSRVEELSFSVEGTREDLIGDQFAAHYAGLENGEGGFFGGAMLLADIGFPPEGDGPAAVPLPPAAWLLASGVMGMIALSRRRGGADDRKLVA